MRDEKNAWSVLFEGIHEKLWPYLIFFWEKKLQKLWQRIRKKEKSYKFWGFQQKFWREWGKNTGLQKKELSVFLVIWAYCFFPLDHNDNTYTLPVNRRDLHNFARNPNTVQGWFHVVHDLVDFDRSSYERTLWRQVRWWHYLGRNQLDNILWENKKISIRAFFISSTFSEEAKMLSWFYFRSRCRCVMLHLLKPYLPRTVPWSLSQGQIVGIKLRGFFAVTVSMVQRVSMGRYSSKYLVFNQN